jgi:hypothetical protein
MHEFFGTLLKTRLDDDTVSRGEVLELVLDP